MKHKILVFIISLFSFWEIHAITSRYLTEGGIAVFIGIDDTIENYPDPSLQIEIINKDYYNYPSGFFFDELIGNSIRAFLGQINAISKEKYEGIVFMKQPFSFVSVVDFDEGEEIRNKQFERQKNSFEKYSFSYYPIYENFNLEKILSDNKLIILAEVLSFEGVNIRINLYSYFPVESQEETVNQYYKITCHYQFSLGYNLNEDWESSVKEIIDFADLIKAYHTQYGELSKNVKDSYMIRNNSLFERVFKWQFVELWFFLDKINIDQGEVESRIAENIHLFN